ncbi:MAG: hypothetical protein QXP81_06295 [Nitrososphaerota archaeon]
MSARRYLRLGYPIGVAVGARIAVVLVDDQGREREAFLDPSRIGRLYVKGRMHLLEYETDSPFYDRYAVDAAVNDAVVMELEITAKIRKVGRVWYYPHPELADARLERYCYFRSLADALYCMQTNIHPYLGVLD